MFFDEYEDLTTSIRELENGFNTYHNCGVVVGYYGKYGYTQHLNELIGEESIVKEAVAAVGKFFIWLKEKIKEICKKIWKFILKVVNFILKLFGFKPIGDSDSTSTSVNTVNKSMDKVTDKIKHISIRNNNDLVFMKHHIGNIREWLIDDIVVIDEISNRKVDVANDDYVNTYNKIIQDVVNKTCNALSETKEPLEYYARELKEFLEPLSANARHCLSVAATVEQELQEFQSKVSEKSTVDDIVKYMVAMNGSLEWNMITVGYKDDDNPRELVMGFIKYIMTNLKALLTVSRRIAPVIENGAKAFNTDNVFDHEVQFNSDLLRRMSEFFGEPFKITKVIFSTKDPHTWELQDEEYTTNAWCCSGKNLHGATIMYVNYRLVRAQLKHYNDIDKVARTIVKHMVHEGRHLFDAQTGKDFDNFSIRYEDRQHEQRAFRDQEIFYITDRDIKWVKDIIRHIESLYGDK